MNHTEYRSSARIQIDYPTDCPQTAEVRPIKSMAGIQWDITKGSLIAQQTSRGLRFAFERSKEPRDSLICIDIRPLTIAARRGATHSEAS